MTKIPTENLKNWWKVLTGLEELIEYWESPISIPEVSIKKIVDVDLGEYEQTIQSLHNRLCEELEEEREELRHNTEIDNYNLTNERI